MKFELSKVKNAPTVSNDSPYVTYGRGQKLKINAIELSASQNTGNPKVTIHVETEPVKDESFIPVEGYKGRVGKVACGVYMKTDEQKTEFLGNMKAIAEAMGLSDEVDEIGGETFEEVVQKIETLFKSSKKYARFTIYAEEYAKKNTRTGIKLFLPRYNFVESLEVPEDKSKLAPFDKESNKCYRKLPSVGDTIKASTLGSDASDLPF